MGKVNFLPGDVVNKIAAGEVVERPASVVKELVENSIDAGAENVFVDIRSAGKTLISVRDDGSGIEPDDVEKIFRRHATSKITTVADLYGIRSMGFRGEALYSIGAVADVILKSRHRDGQTGGKELHIRGGENLGLKDIGHPGGTTVEVRELFFNTPARKKFLKSDATEFRRILNIIVPYAVFFYDRRFSLYRNGRNVFICNPSPDFASRFCDVVNVDRKKLISGEKELKERGLSANVILGDINLKRPGRDRQYIFINGRPVYSQPLAYSVNQVYRMIFPRDVYPVFAVFLALPFEDIDVNIHPSKREVKLKDESFISSFLSEFCREILLGKGRPASAVKKTAIYFEAGRMETKPFVSESVNESDIFGEKQSVVQPVSDMAQEPIRTRLSEASYIGSYRNKYLLFESLDALLAIDQHAAHERINYEILKKQFETGRRDIQRLLTPLLIKLHPEEMSAWEEGNRKIEEVGFLTTRWDKGSIALHGFPQVLKNPEAAVRNILSEKGVERFDAETLARKACRGSVLAGERIRPEEAVYIKNELLKCEVPFVCPHGRPTVVEFTESFFDRQFLR